MMKCKCEDIENIEIPQVPTKLFTVLESRVKHDRAKQTRDGINKEHARLMVQSSCLPALQSGRVSLVTSHCRHGDVIELRVLLDVCLDFLLGAWWCYQHDEIVPCFI